MYLGVTLVGELAVLGAVHLLIAAVPSVVIHRLPDHRHGNHEPLAAGVGTVSNAAAGAAGTEQVASSE